MIGRDYLVISMDFLAQLRGYYINRSRFATFQSVILAGVCDIRNLKRKMRPEEEHKDNSPWNIAADFDIDMSFSTEEINDMLLDYASEQELEMDTKLIAREIHDYTSGYPYLVSRICQLLDEMYKAGMYDAWSHTGLLEVVRKLVRESMNDYHLERGYMLSFNFNKNKKPGVKEIHFQNHTLVEAVV